jgi:hypothetical protein
LRDRGESEGIEARKAEERRERRETIKESKAAVLKRKREEKNTNDRERGARAQRNGMSEPRSNEGRFSEGKSKKILSNAGCVC